MPSVHAGDLWYTSGMNIKHLFAAALAAALACALPAASEDFARHVNPSVGCAFNGHCFAAAAYPFGLVQSGPDTGNFSWNYTSGYRDADTTILGFSQTHLSGTGCPDLGDILVMPYAGARDRKTYASAFAKATETATPGYYGVTLADNGVKVEVTVAPHAAIYRFTFLRAGAHVLVDPQWGIVSNPKALHTHVVEASSEVEGNVRVTGRNRNRLWVDREFSYVVEFSQAATGVTELPKQDSAEKAVRRVFDFDVPAGGTLYMKVALSSVDLAGARRNLAAEIPGWDFDGVRAQARAKWNDLLGRVRAEGDADQLVNLYTALYHLFIHPNDIADVDGRYRGADNQVRTAPLGHYYSTLSLWDTFRAAHPLYTLLAPEYVPGFISSMVEHHKAAGYLPIWTLWGKDNQCMIGTHSVPAIVDAYLKGFGGFDPAEAYEAIRNSLREKHDGRRKERWDLLDKYGYYPFDEIKGESVSRTLECAYDDWCAAQMAEKLGKKEDAAFFRKRSANWRNVFDKSLGLVRGRDTKGAWRTPFDPARLGHGAGTANDFTEGNAWQYTWHVMQDPEGLVSMFGGAAGFAKQLDALFVQPEKTEGAGFVLDVTGLIGQYAHGNEPSHHVVYFYPYAGRPHRTAELVREVFDKFYLNKPDGLCGNDDCGQMSAWYVFSALGFYPFNPCGDGYVLGAPQIPRAELSLEGGKKLVVRADGLSCDAKYVKGVTLNGKPFPGFKLAHEQVAAGGELVFEMTSAAPAPTDAKLAATAPALVYKGAKKRLVCLDLDATLCQHRSAPPPENLATLRELMKRYKCIMVGAGNAPRIYRQMGNFPIDILANYGMQESKMVDGEFRIVRQVTNQVDQAFFRRETDRLRAKYGYTKYYGNPIEFHASGMVTFGLLGTTPPKEMKMAFDPDKAKRRAMYAEVCEVFKDYSVFIGGSSSFDFAGPQYNKYDCVMTYAREHGYARDEIIFIGDDFGDGGGDSHVRLKGLDYIEIEDYRKFPERVAVLLK